LKKWCFILNVISGYISEASERSWYMEIISLIKYLFFKSGIIVKKVYSQKLLSPQQLFLIFPYTEGENIMGISLKNRITDLIKLI